MNVDGLFKFSTLGSISQYGTLQEIMGDASLSMIGKESNNFQQLLELIELKSVSTT